MKNSIKTLSLILSVFVLFVACNTEPSLQQYYVEKQESDDFLLIDIPSSIVSLKSDADPETVKAFESIKKLNLLAFKITDENKQEYTTEKAEIKKILDGKSFNELLRVNHQGMNINVKYIGKESQIDEVVVFAANNNKGFALVRVIGDDMKPEEIIKLIDNIDSVDENNMALSQIEGLFK